MLVLRLSLRAAALFALGSSFAGTPFFGPSVLGVLFGQSSAIAITSVAIVANLLLVPVTVVVLEAGRRPQQGPGADGPAQQAMGGVVYKGILHATKQPYVWGPVAGLVLALIGAHVPAAIDSMLNLIGQTTSGVSLFVAGLLPAAYSLKLNGVIANNAILKSFVQPALVLALVRLVGIPSPVSKDAVVAAALPAAVIVPMLAGRYRTYEAEAGSTMILTVVLMIAAVPAFVSATR
jgi:malonate transporter